MDTHFVLGFIVCICVIEIIANVVMILKIKKLENEQQSTLELVESNRRDSVQVVEDLFRSITEQARETISEAKSYTDSRFDKAIDTVKK